MQTPLWVPIVVAAIGVLGTVAAGLGGVLIAQRSSDRRDELTFQRERERERERRSREDELRTFEHRRDAYAKLFLALQEITSTIRKASSGESLPSGLDILGVPELNQVRIYGSAVVAEAARKALTAAQSWTYAKRKLSREQAENRHNSASRKTHMRASMALGGFEGAEDRYLKAEKCLLDAVRRELEAPGGGLPPPTILALAMRDPSEILPIPPSDGWEIGGHKIRPTPSYYRMLRYAAQERANRPREAGGEHQSS